MPTVNSKINTTGIDNPDKPEDSQDTTEIGNQSSNFAFYLMLLIIALIKDIFEIVLGLIPFVSLLTFVVSIPLTVLIYILLIVSKKLGAWRLAASGVSQLLDAIPFLNFLPITTIMVLILMLTDKSKIGKKVSKIIPKLSFVKAAN